MKRNIYSASEEIMTLNEKVSIIADEVISILKQLSHDNRKQLDVKLIAEMMLCKENVQKILSGSQRGENKSDSAHMRLRELSNNILDRLTELVPPSMTDKISELKDGLHKNEDFGGPSDWLEPPVKFIKKYFDSLSRRNSELEEFMQQTMKYLADTESHLADELSSHQQKFRIDRDFEEGISSNMDMIKHNFSVADDFNSIRNAVMSKIDNINRGIDRKRDQDMLMLKETEQTIEQMGKKMNDIKREADEIRKKSREIEFESVRDSLTGLYNRKAYDTKMEETLSIHNRYKVSYSLLVCDIDFFKKINDSYGHKVGDLALKKLSALLKERLRENDFIARYGGEEFAIILPHTNLSDAAKAGESIRSYIRNSVFSYKNNEIPLTISIGVSSFRTGDDGITVFERADKALYLAKRAGRNQVKTEEDVINEGAILKQSASKL